MTKSFNTINPATEEVIHSYQFQSDQEISDIIDALYQNWLNSRLSSIADRSEKLIRLASILRDRKIELGKLITTEMGKPISQSIAEVEKCAWVCEYYAVEGPEFIKPKPISTEAKESFVHYSAMGVIFAVMPWNFPFWQVFRCAAPNLLAGNGLLLKHSPNTTGCGLMIESLITDAGFSPTVFKTIVGDIPQIELIIANSKIAGVTLTGSITAGKSIGALAGKYLKKSVLELGGSDPYLIFDDADLKHAARECVNGRFLNTGQSCIAAKRFIVTSKNIKAFTDEVYQLVLDRKLSDPLNTNANMGAIARSDLRTQLHAQVTKSIEMGAKLLCGGYLPDMKGFFYPATLLTNVTPDMPAFKEELFGPVAVIIEAKNESELISLANDTEFGLGAALFTTDLARAKMISTQLLEAGCCFINSFVKSDPRLPFGGIKKSGYGRELSEIGMTEFMNMKTIHITQ